MAFSALSRSLLSWNGSSITVTPGLFLPLYSPIPGVFDKFVQAPLGTADLMGSVSRY